MEAAESLFFNPLNNPHNKDFFHPESLRELGYGSGVLDMSTCSDKVGSRIPIYLTLPFFNKASSEIHKEIVFEGDIEKDHNFRLYVEPVCP